MDLGQIRSAVLEWLNEPDGEYWAPAGDFGRLDQLINEAYEEVVAHLDRLPHAWSAVPESSGQTVSIVAGQREYQLAAMRRPLQVFELTAGVQGREVPVFEYGQRERGENGVYFFHSKTDGRFYLGLCDVSSGFTSLRVIYRPELNILAGETDVPYEVPGGHHRTIVYGAALRAKIQENREAEGMAVLYRNALDRMITDCGEISVQHRSPRMGR